MTDTKQTNFWAQDYANNYIKKNTEYDREEMVNGWRQMLSKAEGVQSVLECGSNIGINIACLDEVVPNAQKSIIEISKPAYDIVTENFNLDRSFNGPILDAPFEAGSFDLVFTMGVLIHIHPDDLMENMAKIYSLSSRYVLMGEYFSQKPEMIEYQGKRDLLFKRDFGRMFADNFDVGLVDYGFLWKYATNQAYDDITWWLFKKN